MKIIILIAAIIIGLVSFTNAQENKTDFRDRVLFGLKGGANYSNVYDAKGETFTADPKLGIAAGAFLALPIGKYIGIQPEVLLSQKGFQASGSIFGSSYNIKRTTTYIDVPILFSFKPSEFISIVAGPQYSYLLKQQDNFTSSAVSIAQQKDFSNTNLRKNVFCATGGLDFTLKHLVIGLRAGWDIQNNNGDGTSANPRYKNVWYQATIGYRFYNK